MGTTLTGTTPQDTYDSLIKVTDNGPLSGTAKYLSDGLGNDSVLALSTARVGIGTTSLQAQLHIDGTTAESSFIMERDTVAANSVIGQIKFTNNNGTTTYGTLLGGRNAAGDGYSALGTGIGTNLYAVEGGNVGIGTSAPIMPLEVIKNSNATLVGNIYYSSRFLQDSVAARGILLGYDSTSQVAVIGAETNGPASSVAFYTYSGSVWGERARVTTNGLTFNGDTAAANALDDYEEGTWTMGVSFGGASVGVTYANNTGTYTKIGRQVTINGIVGLSNKGSSTGQAAITGLPFTIGNSNSNYAAPAFRFAAITFTNQFQGYGEKNSTRIEIEEITVLGTVTTITNADFANNSEIMVNFTYFV